MYVGSRASSRRNSHVIVVVVRQRALGAAVTLECAFICRWALGSDLKSCVWQTSPAARPFRRSFNVAAHAYFIAVQWVGGLARIFVLNNVSICSVREVAFMAAAASQPFIAAVRRRALLQRCL